MTADLKSRRAATRWILPQPYERYWTSRRPVLVSRSRSNSSTDRVLCNSLAAYLPHLRDLRHGQVGGTKAMPRHGGFPSFRRSTEANSSGSLIKPLTFRKTNGK